MLKKFIIFYVCIICMVHSTLSQGVSGGASASGSSSPSDQQAEGDASGGASAGGVSANGGVSADENGASANGEVNVAGDQNTEKPDEPDTPSSDNGASANGEVSAGGSLGGSGSVDGMGGGSGSRNLVFQFKELKGVDDRDITYAEDKNSSSGYDLYIKDELNKYYFDPYFRVYMYLKSSKDGNVTELMYEGRICDLIDPNSKYGGSKNSIQRQIMKLIFTEQEGCNPVKAGKTPISRGALLKYVPEESGDPDILDFKKIPDSFSWYLLINIVPQRNVDEPVTGYLVSVLYQVYAPKLFN